MLQRREEVMGSAGASEAQAARAERAEGDRKHDTETMGELEEREMGETNPGGAATADT